MRRSHALALGRSLLLAGAVLLSVGAPGRLSAQYPTTAPAPAALRPVRFPPFANQRLANGISVLVVAKREQPVVTISLSFGAGSIHDPADKAGLASMVAGLLTKGTATQSADQLAAEVEGMGGSIGAGADDDFLTVSVSGLSENTERLLGLLAGVVRNAAFPEAEVELARTQTLSGLQASLADPGYLAGRQFTREVYRTHPYGRWTTPATVRAITRDDITRFFGERIRPAGALLVVAGDVDAARIQAMATRAFAGWTGAAPAATAETPVAPLAGREIVIVHKPGAVQSNIVAGFPFITPRDPAFYALNLMNRVLGGGADSRLFMILREQKGWTYGAQSGFSRPRGQGSFQASAEVRTEVTDSAVAELISQLNRMRTETPPDSEITSAKNYLVGRFPLTIETADAIAGRVASARLLGLPDDYVIRYRERTSAVTPAQLSAAARRYLTTDRMTIVIVGDAPRILPGLRALNIPLRLVNTEGAAMTEQDLNPPATAVQFDASRITAGTWEYRVLLVQGATPQAIGTETRTVSQAQSNGRTAWRMTSSVRIGPIISQDDTLLIDAASLAPFSIRQGGTQQGQNTFVRLDYEGGRVRGGSRTMSQQGPRELTIDTTVAAGTFDDNSLALLLTAIPYTAGARYTLPVFSGGKGQVEVMTVVVAGEENLTTPAGTFPVWRLDITGGEVPVTMYVAREAPRTIVKIELVGVPLVFELNARSP